MKVDRFRTTEAISTHSKSTINSHSTIQFLTRDTHLKKKELYRSLFKTLNDKYSKESKIFSIYIEKIVKDYIQNKTNMTHQELEELEQRVKVYTNLQRPIMMNYTGTHGQKKNHNKSEYGSIRDSDNQSNQGNNVWTPLSSTHSTIFSKDKMSQKSQQSQSSTPFYFSYGINHINNDKKTIPKEKLPIKGAKKNQAKYQTEVNSREEIHNHFGQNQQCLYDTLSVFSDYTSVKSQQPQNFTEQDWVLIQQLDNQLLKIDEEKRRKRICDGYQTHIKIEQK